MQEYITKAVILKKQTRNDADARYSFLTERFGKIVSRAKSSRKIVSKLAGHLEPGTISSVRIIEQHGAQVVDALKIARLDTSLKDLSALDSLLSEWEPDEALWNEVIHGHFSWANILAILGWDPRGALCAACGRPNARNFFIPRQEFFCANCASKARRNELLLIEEIPSRASSFS